jgi:predicted small lipoprotein YifL
MNMKKPFTYFLAIVILATAIIACKKKEKVKLPKGEEEVVVPCSGPQYFTDKKTFRANAMGESQDQMVAKRKALSNCRDELARSINAKVKAVTDNYVNSREFNNKEEVEERYENLTREVVEQELAGTKTICEKLIKTQQGTYKYYIAIELTTDDLLESYNKRMQKLSQEERLKIDYDYEKFKKTFEAEMEKLSNNR